MRYIVRARKPELCPEDASMLRQVHAEKLARVALTGQARAEELREAQSTLYRGLTREVTREEAFTRAYGTATAGVGSAVVYPLRDPSSRGHAGLYRERRRREDGERRAAELAALASWEGVQRDRGGRGM